MRVLLSIPSLMPGGAERQFVELAAGLARRRHEVLAVTLGRGGPLAEGLGEARLIELGKRSRLDNLRVSLALVGLLRAFRPQVHYAFLTAPCILGALLRPFFPATALAMGIRSTDVTHEDYGHGRAGRLAQNMEAWLSARADMVIANSESGRRDALKRGFPQARTNVVHNGVDTVRCHPDKDLGKALRAEWGLGPEHLLIGLVARLDPMKDHSNFLKAATLLAAQRPEIRFVCVGGGPQDYAMKLRHQAASLDLNDRLVWAGVRMDMDRVYNALDVLCLSSAYGEGFPNVLGEAMACGVPCCATDVGDAALVLGEAGVVVPRGDAPALAEGLAVLLARLDREGEGLRRANRERISTLFSVKRMVKSTEELLMRLPKELP